MSVFDLFFPHGPPDDVERCFDTIKADGIDDYCQLAVILVCVWEEMGVTRVGLGGGQGAGKSTLCKLIQRAAGYFEQEIAVLGIDDFYLTKAERTELGESVHPALFTRGPPGTHHVDWLMDAICRLERGETVLVPVFDKALDDRTGVRSIDNHPSRVVVEGWCVGAKPEPQSRLVVPVNELERTHDVDMRWRNFVNECLHDEYAKLNGLLQALVYLQVPDVEAVNRWRWQQEFERAPERRMSPDEVSQFVQYYERITRWMMEDLPGKADWSVELDAQHRVRAVRIPQAP